MLNAGTQCTTEEGEEAEEQRKLFMFKFSLTCLRIRIFISSVWTDCEWNWGSSSGDHKASQLLRTPISHSAVATSISNPEFILPETLHSGLWQLTSMPSVLPTWNWKSWTMDTSRVWALPFQESLWSGQPSWPLSIWLLGAGGWDSEPNTKWGGFLSVVPFPNPLWAMKPSSALSLLNFHISKVGAWVWSLRGAAPLGRNAQGWIHYVGSINRDPHLHMAGEGPGEERHQDIPVAGQHHLPGYLLLIE